MKPRMRPLQSSFTLPAAWCGHTGPRGQVGRGREPRATGHGGRRLGTHRDSGHAPATPPHPRPIGPQSTAAVCSEAPPRPRPRLTLSLGQSDRETEWSRSVRSGFAWGSAGKQSACNAGDPARLLGRDLLEKGNGYSCLEDSTGRGASRGSEKAERLSLCFTFRLFNVTFFSSL